MAETMPRCPHCRSKRLVYIQKTYERWGIAKLPENGQIELTDIQESTVDDDYEAYILCDMCETEFDLDMNRRYA